MGRLQHLPSTVSKTSFLVSIFSTYFHMCVDFTPRVLCQKVLREDNDRATSWNLAVYSEYGQ
jgi:hypothetical protein